MKAVIPAAGLGTRFLPATKNSPKEMLPVVDKPAIQYVVEECVASGIDDILIITGRGKDVIEDHFDEAPELEAALAKSGNAKALKEIRRIAEMADIHYVRQRSPRGLGHAISCAAKHVGNEPFAVLLGDDIVVGDVPCTRQLLDRYAGQQASIVAVERVPRDRLGLYGVVKVGKPVAPGLYPVLDLVEKPDAADAPSDLGILGRYVLTPRVFQCLAKTKPGKGGELQLTDALRLLLEEERIFAYEFAGTRYDLGNKLEWLKMTVDLALRRDDLGPGLRAFLRERAAIPPSAEGRNRRR